MRNDWVEVPWDIEDGRRLAEKGIHGSYYMWFAYKGTPLFYVSDENRMSRPPSGIVHDVEVLEYARALWELSR